MNVNSFKHKINKGLGMNRRKKENEILYLHIFYFCVFMFKLD